MSFIFHCALTYLCLPTDYRHAGMNPGFYMSVGNQTQVLMLVQPVSIPPVLMLCSDGPADLEPWDSEHLVYAYQVV